MKGGIAEFLSSNLGWYEGLLVGLPLVLPALAILLTWRRRGRRRVHGPIPKESCPQCNGEVQPVFLHCPHCGSTLKTHCPHCHHLVKAGLNMCPHCKEGEPRQSGKESLL